MLDCNTAAYYDSGTSKSKVGTATAAQVLSGYTFTNANSVGLTGSMVNRGTLNWNPTSSTMYTLQPGYYSGGTLSSLNAYNSGYNAGKNAVNGTLSLTLESSICINDDGNVISDLKTIPVSITITNGVVTYISASSIMSHGTNTSMSNNAWAKVYDIVFTSQ